MKKLINLSTFFIAFMLISTSMVAQDLTFEDWDKNEDTFISRSEFIDVFKKNYVNDWNVVDDDHLDDEDFFKATYAIWDYDNDGFLEEAEWLYGYDYYYGDYIVDDFVAIDVDGDGFIEYTEYYDILYKTDYYGFWDLNNDGYLSEGELARMVFNNWDINNHNFIELDEYTLFDAYYLDI